MPKEIDFSSYQCDCGHQSHFFANTIKEAKTMSQRRTVRLGDSEAHQHTIVFEHGKLAVPKPILRGNPQEKVHAVANDHAHSARSPLSVGCAYRPLAASVVSRY